MNHASPSLCFSLLLVLLSCCTPEVEMVVFVFYCTLPSLFRMPPFVVVVVVAA